MKQLPIIFFLLLVFQLSNCQQSLVKNTRHDQPAKVIFMLSGSIIADAAGDALCATGHKLPGHSLQALSIGFLLPLVYMLDLEKGTWGWYLSTYCLLRISLFDPAYNLTRDQPLNYIGNCSLWDKGLQEFNPPSFMLTGARILTFSIGIKIPIDHL